MQTLTIKQARALAARHGTLLSLAANAYKEATGRDAYVQTAHGPLIVADRLQQGIELSGQGDRYRDDSAPMEWSHRYGVSL